MSEGRTLDAPGPEAPAGGEISARRAEGPGPARDSGEASALERKRAILSARAAQLAEPARAESAAGEGLEVIVFALAHETYGLELSFVREVHHLGSLTPLPGAPPFVLGVVNVRGEIVSVVDLKKFFNLPERGLGELNKVIILRGQDMEFGVLADAIVGARRIPAREIAPAPPTVTGIGAGYLKGVTSERLIILDAAKILQDEEMVVRQEAE